jgi:hypothetical protein
VFLNLQKPKRLMRGDDRPRERKGLFHDFHDT